jgi:zeaxanthin glucosyltransferase
MSHFGILSFPGTGHLHPLTALGKELASRGHEVTVFQVADVEPLVRASGLGFHRIGALDFPPGKLRSLDARLSRLHGEKAMHFVFSRMYENSRLVLRDAPAAIRFEGIDGLIVDQTEFAGGSVADSLGIPFVTAILTLPLNMESHVPFSEEDGGPQSRLDRQEIERYRRAQAKRLKLINRQRKVWGLAPLGGASPFDSKLAQISQLPAGFDIANGKATESFHYTGPFFDSSARRKMSFPWDKLDPEKPLVFISMGTLQNGLKHVFRLAAQAAAGFPVQTVISLGGGMKPEDLGPLPGNPIVVSYAPQLELLERAALTIFHGGLNTALESLAHGVPMIAIPVTFDQPGVGARLVRSGTGRTIPMGELSAERLAAEMAEILSKPQYKERTMWLQSEIAAGSGVARAANLIERALEPSSSWANNAGRHPLALVGGR